MEPKQQPKQHQHATIKRKFHRRWLTRRTSWRLILVVAVLLQFLVYFLAPLSSQPPFQLNANATERQLRADLPVAHINSTRLDSTALNSRGQIHFAGQFHAPESLAFGRSPRAFFTAVEGGFLLWVEPKLGRWSLVAKLNGRQSVEDQTGGRANGTHVPFCDLDVQLYGPEAEFEPKLVKLSRCSRPLGIRLAPDESYLYAVDPLSGLFRVNLKTAAGGAEETPQATRVIKLLDFNQSNIKFGDDLAVEWAPAGDGGSSSDVIYFTDCSTKWPLRYLLWMMLEQDSSGRLMRFEPDTMEEPRLRQIEVGVVADLPMSFPNGLELTSNNSALLISDLNNRRILMHHLRGPLAGQTRPLLSIPGFNDNLKRGLDTSTGEPTYWFACGCAYVHSDDNDSSPLQLDLLPVMQRVPAFIKRLAFNWAQVLGGILAWACPDAGLLLQSCWLKWDPICQRGLVGQFDERGQVLRAYTSDRSTSFRLLSEAHEVPADEQKQRAVKSVLYLGSVYYSHLGSLELDAGEGN